MCNPYEEFTCKNGRCLPLASKCDYHEDCEEGEDEIGCRKSEPTLHFVSGKDCNDFRTNIAGICLILQWRVLFSHIVFLTQSGTFHINEIIPH